MHRPHADLLNLDGPEHRAAYDQLLREMDAAPVPALPGPRTVPATPAQLRVLERPVKRTPDTTELHELHAYLRQHCWKNGRASLMCVETSRLLLHLYGGTVTGGWPGNLDVYTAGNDPGSGYWYRGRWWHHLWLEQRRGRRDDLLIDLTSAQFRHPDQTEDFTVLPVRAAARYVPTHQLGDLARSVAHRKNRDRVRAWLEGWKAVHG